MSEDQGNFPENEEIKDNEQQETTDSFNHQDGLEGVYDDPPAASPDIDQNMEEEEAGESGQKEDWVGDIFVGNVSRNVGRDELEAVFGHYGEISRVEIKSRYAFIRYGTREGFDAVLEAYEENPNNFVADGEILSVSKSRNSSRPQGQRLPEVFVGGLGRRITDEDSVRKHFSQYGEVVDCRLYERYGFIEFSDLKGAQAAMSEHGNTVFGVRLEVNYSNRAEGRGRRQRGGDRRGGGRQRGGDDYDDRNRRDSYDDRRRDGRYERRRRPDNYDSRGRKDEGFDDRRERPNDLDRRPEWRDDRRRGRDKYSGGYYENDRRYDYDRESRDRRPTGNFNPPTQYSNEPDIGYDDNYNRHQ